MLQDLLRAARQTFLRLTHAQMPPRQILSQQPPAGDRQRARAYDRKGKGILTKNSADAAQSSRMSCPATWGRPTTRHSQTV